MAFLSAVRALIVARGLIAQRVGAPPEQVRDHITATEHANARHLAMCSVLQDGLDRIAAIDSSEARAEDRDRVNAVFAALIGYKVACLQFLGSLSARACAHGADAARAVEGNARATDG